MSIEERFVTSVPLAVEVAPEDGHIGIVGPYRHTVFWADKGDESTVTYCNNCGSVFTLIGKLKKEADPQERVIRVCVECGIFQGFPT